MTSRKAALLAAVFATLSVFCAAALLTRRAEMSRRYDAVPALPVVPAGLPVLGAAPAFELIDESGQPVTQEQFTGKIWVADFIFTTCRGPCPKMTEQMARLAGLFRDEPRVNFLSITVDPETDTPEVLHAYAEGYGADPARWRFATGPLKRIHALAAQGFKVGSLDAALNHSTRFILVDGDGNVRGYYTGTEPVEVEELANDIRLLLEGRA